MRVGVAGGTGFLGSRLVRRLLDRGDDVIVYTRNPEAGACSLPPGTRFETWDALGGPLPPRALEGVDAVVNLLGLSVAGLWTRGRKERMRATRVEGTANLVAGMQEAEAPPGAFVSSSAVGIYGSRGDRILAEDAEPGAGYLAEMAVAWEAEARRTGDLGSRVVLLRTGLPLDPGGGLLGILAPVTRWGGGAILGRGDQWIPWIHMEDWLDLVLFLLDTEAARGAVNACAPEPSTQAAFARTLGTVLGRPVPWRVPAWLLRLGGEAAKEMALASTRAVPAKALGLGFRFRFADLEGALRDLVGKESGSGSRQITA